MKQVLEVHTKKTGPKEKEFIRRNSLLTDLLENVHIRTVYNILIMIFLSSLIHSIASGYFLKKELTHVLKPLKLALGKIHIVILITTGYFVGACLNYFCFKIWARARVGYSKSQLYVWDRFWLAWLAAYYIFCFQCSSKLTTIFMLPPGSSAIVVMEQIRLLMKIHSFVRNTAPKVLQHKPHTETELHLASFSHFLYFLYAPTLIYNDVYPRTEKIRWNFVFHRFLEMVCAVIALAIIFEKTIETPLSEFGRRKYTINEMFLHILEKTIAGSVILFVTCFLLLHSMQNLFAELTRFGDRLFYSDWWTVSDVSQFFPKWNILVQDWLYFYVYKECQENLFKNNKPLSKMTVILISAAVHEFVIIHTLGFFLPVLLIGFFLVSPFLIPHQPKTQFSNFMFLYLSGLTLGLVFTLYPIEYYARTISPTTENQNWKDFFIPRFIAYITV